MVPTSNHYSYTVVEKEIQENVISWLWFKEKEMINCVKCFWRVMQNNDVGWSLGLTKWRSQVSLTEAIPVEGNSWYEWVPKRMKGEKVIIPEVRNWRKWAYATLFKSFFFSTDGQRNGVVAREECGVERVFSSLGEIMTWCVYWWKCPVQKRKLMMQEAEGE